MQHANIVIPFVLYVNCLTLPKYVEVMLGFLEVVCFVVPAFIIEKLASNPIFFLKLFLFKVVWCSYNMIVSVVPQPPTPYTREFFIQQVS